MKIGYEVFEATIRRLDLIEALGMDAPQVIDDLVASFCREVKIDGYVREGASRQVFVEDVCAVAAWFSVPGKTTLS